MRLDQTKKEKKRKAKGKAKSGGVIQAQRMRLWVPQMALEVLTEAARKVVCPSLSRREAEVAFSSLNTAPFWSLLGQGHLQSGLSVLLSRR